MHWAAAALPRKLAGVLQREPRLVAPAVLAFHYREPQDVKIAHEMVHFPAEVGFLESAQTGGNLLYFDS